MNKLWKVLLFFFLGFIAVIGIAVFIVYLTGGFESKRVYPDNINFSASSYETLEDFSLMVTTTSTDYTERKIQLDFVDAPNAVVENGYISDGVISVPQFVELNKQFVCKVIKLDDGFNNGGVSTLRARLVDSTINFVTTKIYVDVPVDSLEIYATNEKGELATKFAKGSIISLNANFFPARSEDPYRTKTALNPEGDSKSIKRVEYEISQDYLQYVRFYASGNQVDYTKLEVIGLTSEIEDLSAVVNSYVFSTLKEQNQVTLDEYNQDRFTNIRTSGVSAETKFETVNVTVNGFEMNNFTNLSLLVNRVYNFYVKNTVAVQVDEFEKYLNILVKSNVDGVDVSYRIADITLKAYFENGEEVPSDILSINYVKDPENPNNNYWRVSANDDILGTVTLKFTLQGDEEVYEKTQNFTTKIINIESFGFRPDATEKTLAYIDYEGEENDIFEELDLNSFIILTGENNEIPTYTKVVYFIENYPENTNVVVSDNKGFIENGLVIPKGNGSVNIIAKVVKTKEFNKTVYDEEGNYIFIGTLQGRMKINVDEGLTNLTVQLENNGVEQISGGYLEDTDKIYKTTTIDEIDYKEYVDALLLKLKTTNDPSILERELKNNGVYFTISNTKLSIEPIFNNDINLEVLNNIIDLNTLGLSVPSYNLTINSLSEFSYENEEFIENNLLDTENYLNILRNNNNTDVSIMLNKSVMAEAKNYLLKCNVNGITYNFVISNNEEFLTFVSENYTGRNVITYQFDKLPKVLTNNIIEETFSSLNYDSILGYKLSMLCINGEFIQESDYNKYLKQKENYIQLVADVDTVSYDIQFMYGVGDEKYVIVKRINYNFAGLNYGLFKKIATFNTELNCFEYYYLAKLAFRTLDSHESQDITITTNYVNTNLQIPQIIVKLISKKVTNVSFEHNVYDEEGQFIESIGTIDNPIVINGSFDNDQIVWNFDNQNYYNVIFKDGKKLKYTITPNHASGYSIYSENENSIRILNENGYSLEFIGIPTGYGEEETSFENQNIRNKVFTCFVSIQSDYESDSRFDRLYFKFKTPIIDAEVHYPTGLNAYTLNGIQSESFNLFTTQLDNMVYPVQFYYYDENGDKIAIENQNFTITDITSTKYSDYYDISSDGTFTITQNAGFSFNVLLQISHAFGKSIQYEINVKSILNVDITYPDETKSNTSELVYGDFVRGNGSNGSEVNRKYIVLPAGINGNDRTYNLLDLNVISNNQTVKFIKAEYTEESGMQTYPTLQFTDSGNNLSIISISNNNFLTIKSANISRVYYIKLNITTEEGYSNSIYIAITPNIMLDKVNTGNLDIYAGETNRLKLISYSSNGNSYNYSYTESLIKLTTRDNQTNNFIFTNLDRNFTLSNNSKLNIEYTDEGVYVVSEGENINQNFVSSFNINYYNYILSVNVTLQPNLVLNTDGRYNSENQTGSGLYDIRYHSDSINSKFIQAIYASKEIIIYNPEDENSLLFNNLKKYQNGKYINASNENLTYRLASNVNNINVNGNKLTIASYENFTGITNFILQVVDVSGFVVDVNTTVAPFNLFSSVNADQSFIDITTNNSAENITIQNASLIRNIDFYDLFYTNSNTNYIYGTTLNAGSEIYLNKKDANNSKYVFDLLINNINAEPIDLYYKIINFDENTYAEIINNKLKIYDIASENDEKVKIGIQIKNSMIENSGFTILYILEIQPNLTFAYHYPIENNKNTESIILAEGETKEIDLRAIITSEYPNAIGHKRIEVYNKTEVEKTDIANSYTFDYEIVEGGQAISNVEIKDDSDSIIVKLQYVENATISTIKLYCNNGLVGYYSFEVKSEPIYTLRKHKEGEEQDLLKNYIIVDKVQSIKLNNKDEITFNRDYKIAESSITLRNVTNASTIFYQLNLDSFDVNKDKLTIVKVDSNISVVCYNEDANKIDTNSLNDESIPKIILSKDLNDNVYLQAICGISEMKAELLVYSLDGVIADFHITTRAKYYDNFESDNLTRLYSNQEYALNDLVKVYLTSDKTQVLDDIDIYLVNSNGEFINQTGDVVENGISTIKIAGLDNTKQKNNILVYFKAEIGENEDKEEYFGSFYYQIISSIEDQKSVNNLILYPYNYVIKEGDNNNTVYEQKNISISNLNSTTDITLLTISPSEENLDISWAKDNNVILVQSSYQDIAGRYIRFTKNNETVSYTTKVINGIAYYVYDCDSFTALQVDKTYSLVIKIFNTANNYLFESDINIELRSDLTTDSGAYYYQINDTNILETLYSQDNFEYIIFGDGNNVIFDNNINRLKLETITGRPLKINDNIIFTVIQNANLVNLQDENNLDLNQESTKVILKPTDACKLITENKIIDVQVVVDNVLTYSYKVNISNSSPYKAEVNYDRTEGQYEIKEENNNSTYYQFIKFGSETNSINLLDSENSFYINLFYTTLTGSYSSININLSNHLDLLDFSIAGSENDCFISTSNDTNTKNVVFNKEGFILNISGEKSLNGPKPDSYYNLHIKSKENSKTIDVFNFELKRDWRYNKDREGFTGAEDEIKEIYADSYGVVQSYNLFNLIGLTDLEGNNLSASELANIRQNTIVSLQGNSVSFNGNDYQYLSYNSSNGEITVLGAPNNGIEIIVKIKIYGEDLPDFTLKAYSGIKIYFEDTLRTDTASKSITFTTDSDINRYTLFSEITNVLNIYYAGQSSINIAKNSNLVNYFVNGDIDRYLDTTGILTGNEDTIDGYTKLNWITNIDNDVYGLIFNQPMLGNKYIHLKIVDCYGYEFIINFTLSPKNEIVSSSSDLIFNAGDEVNLFGNEIITVRTNSQYSLDEKPADYFIRNIEVAYDGVNYTSVTFNGEKNTSDYGKFTLDSSLTSSNTYNAKFRITLGSGLDSGVIILDRIKITPSISFNSSYTSQNNPFNAALGEVVDLTNLYNISCNNDEIVNISYNITLFKDYEFVSQDDFIILEKSKIQSFVAPELLNNIYQVQIDYTYNGITKVNYIYIKLSPSYNQNTNNYTTNVYIDKSCSVIPFVVWAREINFTDYNGKKLVRLDDPNLTFSLYSEESGISLGENGKDLIINQEEINWTTTDENYKNIRFTLSYDYSYGNQSVQQISNFVNINLYSYISFRNYVTSSEDCILYSKNLITEDGKVSIVDFDKIVYTDTTSTRKYSVSFVRINNKVYSETSQNVVQFIKNTDKNITEIILHDNESISFRNSDIQIGLAVEIENTKYIQNIFIYNVENYAAIKNTYNIEYSTLSNTSETISTSKFNVIENVENNATYYSLKFNNVEIGEFKIYDIFGKEISKNCSTSEFTTYSNIGAVLIDTNISVGGDLYKTTLYLYKEDNRIYFLNKNQGNYSNNNSSNKISLTYDGAGDYPYYIWHNKVNLQMILVIDGVSYITTNFAEMRNYAQKLNQEFSLESSDFTISDSYINEDFVGFNLKTTGSGEKSIKVKLNETIVYTIYFTITPSTELALYNAYNGNYKGLVGGYTVIADFEKQIDEDDTTQSYLSNKWASNFYILEKYDGLSYNAHSLFDYIESFVVRNENGDSITGASIDIASGKLILPASYSGYIKIDAKLKNNNILKLCIYIKNKLEYYFVEAVDYNGGNSIYANKKCLELNLDNTLNLGDISITYLKYGDIIVNSNFDDYITLIKENNKFYIIFNRTLDDNNYNITLSKNNDTNTTYDLQIIRTYDSITQSSITNKNTSLSFNGWGNNVNIIYYEYNNTLNVVQEKAASLYTLFNKYKNNNKKIKIEAKNLNNINYNSSTYALNVIDTNLQGNIDINIYFGNEDNTYFIGTFTIYLN